MNFARSLMHLAINNRLFYVFAGTWIQAVKRSKALLAIVYYQSALIIGGFIPTFKKLNSLFTLRVSVRITFNIAQEHKENPQRKIREQLYDVGPFEYSGRVMGVTPTFVDLFWQMAPVDITRVDRNSWRQVDRNGNVKFS